MNNTVYLIGIGKDALGEPVRIGYTITGKSIDGFSEAIHCYIGRGPAATGATTNAARFLAPHYETT